MKKPKLSLGPGGLKGLLIQHVEKIVFGVAMLLVLVFVFLGYRLESKLAGKTPDKLRTLATNAVSNIQRPTASELINERTPREGKGGQYFARVQEIAPLDPLVYAIKPWNQPLGRPGSKREDPAVFPPIKLETTALTGALCLRAEEGDEGPLKDLENSPAPEKKEKKTKEKKGKSRGSSPLDHGDNNPYGDFGGMGGGAPGAGPPYGGDEKGDKKKKKDDQPRGPERLYPESKVCGYRPSGSGMFGSSGGMGMPGTGMPGMGMPGTGGMGIPSTGGPGTGPSAGGMGIPSTGPGGGGPAVGGMGLPGTGAGRGMPGMPGGGMAGSDITVPGGPIAASGNVILVKALVPYRKQADEYKRVLGEAIGYDPMRDQPRIVFFQAQRVDVTDDPQKAVDEAAWQLIMTPKTAQTKAKEQRWHGFMREVADYNYVDTYATMPCPPMMLRCMDKAMLHSEVPRGKTLATMTTTGADEGEKKKEDAEGKKEEPDGGLDLPGGMPGGGVAGGGVGGGMTGFPGMPGTGYPGSSGGYPSMPGMGLPGSGGMMPGMGSGMGMGMGGYGTSFSASAELVQYKLIRFCDTEVEPGRVYRYRVRVFLEDPNNPNTDQTIGIVNVPPRRRSLSLKVIERLNKQQADDATKKAFYVVSDWSESTEPVALPSTSRVFAGSVEPARMAVGAEGTQIHQSEVYGNLVPVVWNNDLAIDVSTEVRSYRGSVLDFNKKQFDILDPVSLVIKILKNYDFKNQHMVLDIRGGEDLPGDRKELVTSAGEFALIDDAGNIRVFNELDDYKDYGRFSFEDEIVTGARAGSGMGSGGMMPGVGMPGTGGAGGMPGLKMPGTGPGAGGMPGTSGGRRPKR